MVRNQRHELADGQTLVLDLQRATFPLRWSVTVESPSAVDKLVTVSRTFDWPAAAADWFEDAPIGSTFVPQH